MDAVWIIESIAYYTSGNSLHEDMLWNFNMFSGMGFKQIIKGRKDID